MMRTTATALVLLALSLGNLSDAASYSVSGIHKFNASLGTLDSVEVTLDPLPVMTSEEDVLGGVGNHGHFAIPAPLPLPPGLGVFNFAGAPTSLASNGLGGDHFHFLNLPPSTKTYSNPQLNWFLTPGPPVASVNVPAFFTSQGGTQNGNMHNHRVNLPPITPSTTYFFTPVPEPSAALLCLAGVLGVGGVRRRW